MESQVPTIENQLIFSVAELYKQDEGKTEEFHLEVEQDFNTQDFKLKSPINTDVVLMKVEKGIAAILENVTYDIEAECTRCLKKPKVHMRIPMIERTFHFQRPEKVEDELDLFLVDMKRMEIDLLELFRQEILLHYDPFQVCSDSCKGICLVCGKDRNKADCGHGDIEKVDSLEPTEEVIQPFRDLKSKLKKR